MSQLLRCSYLPQILAGDCSLCKLFSCPGAYIMRFCHRFQLGPSLYRLICHVPAAKMQLFATESGRRLLLVQAFFMSRYQYPALLPQICPEYRLRASLLHVNEAKTPSSAIKSDRNLDCAQSVYMSTRTKCLLCHKFSQESRLQASLLHVKETETPSPAIKCRQTGIPLSSAPA